MEAILNFDLSVFEFFEKFVRMDWLTPIMKIITTLGDDGIFFIILGVVMLFFKKTRKAGLVCLGSLLVMTLLNNELIKPIMERPRPYNLTILPQAAQKAFEEYGIPYFFDRKKSLKQHPLARFVLDIFSAVRDGFAPKTVQSLTSNFF